MRCPTLFTLNIAMCQHVCTTNLHCQLHPPCCCPRLSTSTCCLCCCRLLTYYTLNCGVDFAAESEGANHIPSSTPQHDGDDEWTPFAAPPKAAAEDTKRNPLNDTLPDDNNNSRATPVMFLHGVGGLILYLEMLKHVIALGHPVIVIEYKHVGMRLW